MTLQRNGLLARFALLVTLAGAGASQAQVPAELPGTVRFYQTAGSTMDVHTSNPSAAQQVWMREHYYRMQVWSPYFDSRLSWFPNAWFYKDSYALFPRDNHPEWVLRDASGAMLYIPWGCGGGTCPQFAADVGNPDFRAWWIAQAAATASRGYAGIFVDDVNMSWRISNGLGQAVTPTDPRTGQTMTLNDYQRYFAEFMEQIRAALPNLTIAHNAIWFTDSPDFDNPYVARQIDAADFYNFERGASDGGLTGGSGPFAFDTFLAFIDYVHARGRQIILMDEADNVAERDLALAGWFLVSDGGDLVSSENLAWTTPDTWWAGYDLDFGDSEGPRYTWNGVLRRDFACGLVLVNRPGSATATLSFTEPYSELDGSAVSTVTLPASNARILRKPCPGDSPPQPPGNVTAQ